MKHRERHGRGLRGVLAAPNPLTGAPMPVRFVERGPAVFAGCIRQSIERINAVDATALAGIDIGFEDVPALGPGWYERVPLAAAIAPRQGQNGRIVLYRRPIEHRATSRRELATLVHRAIVEQLAAITGIDPTDLAPGDDEV